MYTLRNIVTAAARPLLRTTAFLVLLIALVACTSNFRKAIERGDELAQQGRWDDAAAAYEQAMGFDPTDPEGIEKFEHARRQQAAQRIAKGKQLMAQGHAKEAMNPFFEAMKLDPRNPEGKAGFEQSKAKVLGDAEAALGQDRNKEAFELARSVLLLEPTNTRGRELEAQARVKIADAAVRRGEEMEKLNKKALAVVEYGEALFYKPDHATALGRLPELRQSLRREVTYHVVLGNFDGDQSADDLGSDVSADKVATGLDPKLPLRVQSKAPQEPKDKSFKLQGMRLGGMFRNYRYDRKSTRSTRACDYICGTEWVANPEYARAESDMRTTQQTLAQNDGRVIAARTVIPQLERSVDQARSEADARRRDLDRAEQDLSNCLSGAAGQPNACGNEQQRRDRAREDSDRAADNFRRAEQDLANGRSELSQAESDASSARSAAENAKRHFDQTPPKVEIDKHCTHNYGVETVSVWGEVEVMLRGEGLYDTTPVLTQAVTGKFNKTDDTFPAQRGVCAEVANGDPLQIPPESEVKRQVVASAVTGTRTQVLEAFDRYRLSHLTRAKEAEVDKRTQDAAELYVRYLYTYPPAPTGKEIDTASRDIARLMGLERKAVDVAIAE